MAAAARHLGPLIACALLAAGCAREDVQLVRRGSSEPADAPDGAITVAPEETARDRYCAGHGPPFQPQSGGACAPPVFQHALCTCGDATFTAALMTDAFDSDEGPGAAPGDGASVGVEGQLVTTGAVAIGGELRVTGASTMAIPTGPFRVAADAAINADLAVAALEVEFGSDLWINGGVLGVGGVNVAGDLHQTRSQPAPALGLTVGGAVRTGGFEIAPPCACDDGRGLDVAALVAEGAQSSHNGELGLRDDALYGLPPDGLIELPCGRFAFGGGRIADNTTVTARGRTALFIDGDLILAGGLGVDLGPGDELDVLVSGGLLLEPTARLGNPDRPAALRLYVGGPGEFVLLNALHFHANLYAPQTNWVVTAPQTFGGSLVAGTYYALADQTLHYDRATPLRTQAEGTCTPR